MIESFVRKRRVAVVMAVLLLGLLSACAQPAPQAEALATATPPAAEEAVAPAPTLAPVAETGDSAAEIADGSALATLLVQLDDRRLLVREIAFTPPISGLAALEASGLGVVTTETTWGPAICSVATVGCPAEDCFCGGDDFWNYAYWTGEAWEGYPVGPSQSVLDQDGALEGWRWGVWEATSVAPDRGLAAQAALGYVLAQQQADGSIGGMGGSVEALMAVGANRLDAAALRPAQGGASLLAYVVENAASYSQEDAAAAGKLAVALSAAGACWPAAALSPAAFIDPSQDAFAADPGRLAWALLGALALGETPSQAALDALVALALPDGGWEWQPGWGADTNTTAVALQVLAAAGVSAEDPAIVAALDYLAAAQSDAGGFAYALDAGGRGAGDANSTAYVIQALLAWGIDPTAPAWQQAGGNPFEYLQALQDASGALGWQAEYPAANLSATIQAVPALLGHAFPVRQAALPACGE